MGAYINRSTVKSGSFTPIDESQNKVRYFPGTATARSQNFKVVFADASEI